MNEILAKVTPLTRGIIWLCQGEPKTGTNTYLALDYLLNGLLTATLKTAPEAGSRVLMTQNFHSPLHIFVSTKFEQREYESYLKLLKKDLISESTVLVIDEADGWSGLASKTPQDIKSLLHLLK